jgi:hypothetical protein
MANTNAPFGLRPLGIAGASPNFETTWGKFASANATKCYRGDAIKQLSTGYLTQWTNATTAAVFAGVFWGCKYMSTSQGRTIYSQYWPGADAASDPDVEFISNILSPSMKYAIQCGATNLQLADIGINADIVVGTGSTTTFQSGSVLDSANINTTNTFPLRVVKLWNGIGNGSDSTTSYNIVIVKANVAAIAGV